MSFKDDAKQWLQTGDFPTQSQFEQISDWQRWKDEQLEVTDIIDLELFVTNLITQANSNVQGVTCTSGTTSVSVDDNVFISDIAFFLPTNFSPTDVGIVTKRNNVIEVDETLNLLPKKPEVLTINAIASDNYTIEITVANATLPIKIYKK